MEVRALQLVSALAYYTWVQIDGGRCQIYNDMLVTYVSPARDDWVCPRQIDDRRRDKDSVGYYCCCCCSAV